MVDPGVLPECRSMHFRNALNSADPVVLLGSIPERETRDGPVDVSPTHGGQMVRYGGAVPQGTAGAAVVGGGVAKCVTGTPRDGRDVEARVDPLAWDGVRQGRGLESSGT